MNRNLIDALEMKYPLSTRAEVVIQNAWNEAARLKHDYLGSEHLLLGLAYDPESPSAQTLNLLGVTLSRLREEVETIVGSGRPDYSPDDLGPTDNAQQILANAHRTALQAAQSAIEPEHLLLGICDLRQSTATQVMCDLRASPDSLRKLLMRRRNHSRANNDFEKSDRAPSSADPK